MVNSTAWAGIVATLLCGCMLICLVDGVGSGSANGESGWKTMMQAAEQGTCGANLTWVLTDGTTLIIYGTGDMENFFLC